MEIDIYLNTPFLRSLRTKWMGLSSRIDPDAMVTSNESNVICNLLEVNFVECQECVSVDVELWTIWASVNDTESSFCINAGYVAVIVSRIPEFRHICQLLYKDRSPFFTSQRFRTNCKIIR